MKILHVVHNYAPSIGGSQWFVKKLSEQLVAQFGDDVTVFTTNALDTAPFAGRGGNFLPPGTEVINGVTVRRFAIDTRFALARKAASALADRLHLPGWDILRALHQGPIVPGLAQAVAHSGADVVMAMAFPLWHMFVTQSGARQAGIPLVFTGALHPAGGWNYDRPMIFRAIRRAQAYIALTPFEKEFLTGRGLPAERIAIIGGGVTPPPDDAPLPETMRTGLGLSPDAPLILALGRQNRRKRFELLLEAMPAVWQKFPEAKLVLAGAADESTPVLRQFGDARVVVQNDVPEAEKHGLLSACDVLVLPSTEESFGIVFAEAWWHGKPVIGARVGAVESLIDEGEDGLLFEYDNPHSLAQAISDLLAKPEQRKKMGQAGRNKVLQNYTWEVVSHKVRGIYEAAAGKRG
ncbi:MAG: glycosyltransferase family 1 protein [Chloroflexi bacterium]|nr:MAG: glycosyltransferase family 1 protein [Chloroflexota bacterium]